LSRELRNATTNVDIRERGIFELVREREIILHALKCFLKKEGQFTPESRDVIECVKKVNDEWGHRFFTLELLLPKVKSPCAAKFMCHAGDDDFCVRRDPKVLRRVSWILNKEGLHFANLFYIFE
jgi:hypothetical protein